MDKMLDVLLVDDDLLILDDLEMIIDWGMHGFKVVKSLNNGQQALDYLKDKHVDIVIADIEMPKLDGLAFIRKLNFLYPSIKVIILTSFSKFDYAREAISLGVHNYLLKHELTANILLENLNELRDKIEQSNKLLISEDNMYFRNALNSEYNKPLSHIFDFNNNHSLVLIKMVPTFGLKEWFQQDYQNDLMFNILDNEAILDLKHKYPFYLLETNINEWTFGLELDENNKYLPIDLIREIKKYIDTKQYRFVISDVAHTTDLLKKSQDQLNKTLGKLFYQNSYISYAFDVLVNYSDVSDEWFEQFIRIDTINDCVEISKEYLNWLKINQPSLEISSMTIQKMLQTIYKMLGIINDESHGSFDKWQNIKSFSELEKFVDYWLNILSSGHAYSRKTSYVLSYLNENLEKENVLDLLCKEMGMNKDYLSRLVKKECGSSLSTLLLNIRLDKAMSLLKNSNDKVYEIASKCGFSSSQYFSIVFNKKFNIYPKDVSKERIK